MHDEPSEFGGNGEDERQIAKRWATKDGKCTDDALIITELLRGYDKLKIPGGNNVQVSVEVMLLSIFSFDWEVSGRGIGRNSTNTSMYKFLLFYIHLPLRFFFLININ